MRVLGIVSGKGGVGKTTIATNLALALSEIGREVVIVDCNITTSHVGFSFGFYYYPITLNDVLKGLFDLRRAVYKKWGISIIPASLKLKDLLGVDVERIREVIRELDADYVILDSAPGLGKEAVSAMRASDELIYVAMPFINSVADVIRCKRLADSLDKKSLGVVLNMVKGERYELTEKEVEEITGMKVLASVPYDKNVEKSLAYGIPLLKFREDCKASAEILKLAGVIEGVPVYPKKLGLFERLSRKLNEFFSLRKRVPEEVSLI